MDHDMATCPCYKDAVTLIEVRARTNRIRMEAQQMLTHMSECVAILNEDRIDHADRDSWIDAIQDQLALTVRMLELLPRN